MTTRPLYLQKSRGVAILLLLIFFMSASLMITLGIGRNAYYDLARFRQLHESKQVLYSTESGLEDMLYRMRQGQTTSATETITLAGVSVTTVRSGMDPVLVNAAGSRGGLYRTSRASLQLGDGASFNFGLQSHTGGIRMYNTSSVTGNVYSNGQVVGSGSGSNNIYGDAVSAGSSGLIKDVHVHGSAYAHTLQTSAVDGDGYFTTRIGGTVAGTEVSPYSDPVVQDLPIDDTQIEEWKTEAAAGGTVPLASCSGGTAAGTYTINTDTTIGPIKVPCNLQIKKQGASTVVKFQGPVWVEGNIDTSTGPTLQIDSTAVNRSIQLIADKPSDRINSSKITIEQSTGFVGNGASSYFLLVSMNNSSELGSAPIQTAISSENNTASKEVIYYAPHGKIALSQSAKLRGATAHQIELSNTANVEYETGMISILFTGGAGGRYIINSWAETE